MKKILQENWALVIGTLLPILTVLVFLLATSLPKLWVEPLKYNFLYVSYGYDYNTANKSVNIEVSNGKIKISAQNNSSAKTNQTTRLFIFEAKKQASREITFSVPDVAANSSVAIDVPELQNMVLDVSHKSPDGYTVYPRDSYDSGMSSLFFSTYDRENVFILKKDGNSIRVVAPDNVQSNTKFLGWIISQ